MINFRTELTLPPSSNLIDHTTNLLTMGSCFSNSIGEKLSENKFKCQVNSFGTVFNPISIHKLIDLCISKTMPAENTYIFNEGVWKNHLFHSSFFAKTEVELEKKIKKSIDSVHDFLSTTNYLILTYGTAFVYEKLDSQEIVANCHKEPASKFKKRLLTVEEILKSFNSIHSKLLRVNPTLKVILTISPIRHTKDTFELNTVSKSILRLATHNLKEQVDIDYFSAYELMMDDLRDYRFYEADMIHPNQQAIDYIWNKFADRYFSVYTKEVIKKWHVLRVALNHKPFNSEGELHRKFLMQALQQLTELKSVINVDSELKQLEIQILNQNAQPPH